MTDLSPAAQAVVNAVDHYETNHWLTPREVAAAALRAAADQVVPEELLKGSDPDAWLRDEIRQQILAIAAELIAPTLMERALAGDKDAARQFLFEAGFTDEHGQLTGPYKLEQIDE